MSVSTLTPYTPRSAVDDWQPVDWTTAFDGDNDIEPTMLCRIDGPALIYPGEYHEIKGQPGSGKSWVCMALAAEQIQLGNSVMYFDYESRARPVGKRMLQLGVTMEELQSGRFLYFKPGDWDQEVAAAIDAYVAATEPAVAIIDGINQAWTMYGLDTNDSASMAAWLQKLPRHLLDHGVAVVVVDHVSKSADSSNRYSVGNNQKLAQATVSYTAVMTKDRIVKGRTGTLKILVDKDKHGGIDEHTAKTGANANRHIANFEVTSDEEGNCTWRLLPPVQGEGDSYAGPTKAMEACSIFIETHAGCGKTEIYDGVSFRKDTVDEAIAALVGDYVEVKPQGRKHEHRSIRPYREHLHAPWEKPNSDAA